MSKIFNHYVRPQAHSKSLSILKALIFPLLLIGNNEDGFFGDDRWNPERKKDFKTALKWWLRNPFHDLYFHVLGFTDKRTEMWGPFVPSITNTSDEGWNFHFVRPYAYSWRRHLLGFLYIALGFYFHLIPVIVFGFVVMNLAFRAIPVPFISYTSDVTLVKDVYFGWRPSGAFGGKFQINSDVTRQKFPWAYKLIDKLKTISG